MASGFFYVFQLRAVFQRRGDEGGAHRVRRVAAIEPERTCVFPHDAIDPVRVHAPAIVRPLAVVLQRPKHRPVAVVSIDTKHCNHRFRLAAGAVYLKHGGTLEEAAAMTNRASTRTTQLYDRRRDEVSLDEVERIVI